MFSISGNVFYIRHIIIVVYCYSLLECCVNHTETVLVGNLDAGAPIIKMIKTDPMENMNISPNLCHYMYQL